MARKAKYTQADFEEKIENLIREARQDGQSCIEILSGDLLDAVVRRGDSRPATSACSAIRRYANIEMAPDTGESRGECLHTVDSGNSTTVRYKFNLDDFTDEILTKLREERRD